MIDSFFRTGKNCYPEVFLEECNLVVKEKKMPEDITNEIPSDSDREDSDKENPNEENSNEKKLSIECV